jgi:hypothetical protein
VKLGIQTQRLDRAVVDFAIRANIASFKAIAPQPVELLQEIKRALPNCLFIYRPYFHTQPLDDPRRRAREAVEAAMPMLAQFPWDYTELFNETGLWDQAYDYITFTIEAARLLHIAGHKLLAYSFAWGNPPGFASFPYEQDPAGWLEGLRQQWAPYCDGLRAVQEAKGGLAMHQYKIPNCKDMFSILRHRLVRQALPADLKNIPMHLTEFGLDDKANPGQSGWRGSSWNWTAERYAEWLEGISIAIGDEVASAQIFGCGMTGWDSFEVLDQPVIADGIARANQGGNGVVSMGTLLPGMRDVIAQLPRHPTKAMPRRDPQGILGFAIHHTGAVMGKDALGCAIQTANYHIQRNGWPGIAYGVVISLSGESVQSLYLEEMGYHVGEHNPYWFGILLDGDCTATNPTPAQLAELERIIRLRPDWQIKGHYELRPTLCPGQGWFERWRASLTQPPATNWQAEAERLRVEKAELEAKLSHAQHLSAELYGWLR